MPVNLIILVAAVIVAFLIFKALLNLLKTFLGTALAIFIIVVIIEYFRIYSTRLDARNC